MAFQNAIKQQLFSFPTPKSIKNTHTKPIISLTFSIILSIFLSFCEIFF